MKLQRIYHKIENLSLSLKWLNGEDYDSLYKYEGQGPTKNPTIEQVTFGYSYVTDMKMRPYEGRHQDYYAAIDIYVNDKYLIGINTFQVTYLKKLLSQKTEAGIGVFSKGSFLEGETCRHKGWFRASVKKEEKSWSKFYADIWFEFQGQQIEDGRILCLNKGDVTRLIKAFNLCESELYKAIPISTNQ